MRNIRKITRTMELIATARFKKAMDRSIAARDYTKQLAKILENIAGAGADVVHPLLDVRPTERAAVLVLTGNRGLCGGYNSNVVRQSVALLGQWKSEHVDADLAVSGKRGISALKFRGYDMAERYTNFEDKPEFDAVAPIGRAYLEAYAAKKIDRLDVVYTKFHSIARQEAVTETLLPLKPPETTGGPDATGKAGAAANLASNEYDFYPSAESILEEILPASFLSRLLKWFLDAAGSEQVGRVVARSAATEDAGGRIVSLSRR
ncbi:MAG: F0F1 ATP synthase subunit gamma, partial [Planctomycetia bacterium]